MSVSCESEFCASTMNFFHNAQMQSENADAENQYQKLSLISFFSTRLF